jgi:hypothetical protein
VKQYISSAIFWPKKRFPQFPQHSEQRYSIYRVGCKKTSRWKISQSTGTISGAAAHKYCTYLQYCKTAYLFVCRVSKDSWPPTQLKSIYCSINLSIIPSVGVNSHRVEENETLCSRCMSLLSMLSSLFLLSLFSLMTLLYSTYLQYAKYLLPLLRLPYLLSLFSLLSLLSLLNLLSQLTLLSLLSLLSLC